MIANGEEEKNVGGCGGDRPQGWEEQQEELYAGGAESDGSEGGKGKVGKEVKVKRSVLTVAHRLQTLIFIALGLMIAIAKADTVAVTWSGSPTVPNWECGGCPYGGAPPAATATEDGENADLQIDYFSSAWGFAPFSSSTVTDTFTLLSPADIVLSASIDYSSSGTSCSDFGCAGPGWEYSGGFSGSLDIVGSQGTVLDVPFGNAGASGGECGLFGPDACGSGLNLSDSQSGNVQLAVGTYTLVVSYSDQNTSVGDSQSGAQLFASIEDPSAVPEPSYVGFVGLIPFVGLLCRRFHRRSIKI